MSQLAKDSRDPQPKPKQPATPRLSASLILINAQNEILLVQRNTQSTSFAGVHVFPGGNFDAEQDSSVEMTAIRETFEEAGVLLASPASADSNVSVPMTSARSYGLDEKTLDLARKAIHSRKLDFRTFLADHGLKADTEKLLPFTQWITPIAVPKRFHTHFFVAFLPDLSSSSSAGLSSTHRLPTADGGIEILSAQFTHPSDALAAFRSRAISLMPPQYYLLYTLGNTTEPTKGYETSTTGSPADHPYEGILTTRSNTQAQRALITRLSTGPFGRMIIRPHPIQVASSDEAASAGVKLSVLAYEGDEERGGKKGRRHRSTMRVGKGGVVEDIKLERNFDIFDGIEDPTPLNSKL